MATLRWTGRAEPVAQVISVTIGGSPAQNDTYSIVFYHDSVEVGRVTYQETAASPTVSDVAAGLVAAFNASTTPRAVGITASDEGSGLVYLTADTPGTPFDEDVAGASQLGVAKTGSGTITKGSVTANAGPNVWGAAANYEDNAGGSPAAPSDGDTLYIQGGPPILYDLDALNGLTTPLAHVYIDQSFGPSTIGLPDDNPNGYAEFLDRHLELDATALTIGRGDGSGSGRMRIKSLTSAMAIVVHNTGGALDTNRAALQLIGTTGGTDIEVRGGTVEISKEGGAASTLDGSEIEVSGGTLTIWNPTTIGSTAATIQVLGGTLIIEPAVAHASTTITVQSGTFRMLKGCTVAGTITISGPGTVECQSGGSSPDIGTLVMSNEEATFDASQAVDAVTITTASGVVLGTIIDPHKKISNASLPDARLITLTD